MSKVSEPTSEQIQFYCENNPGTGFWEAKRILMQEYEAQKLQEAYDRIAVLEAKVEALLVNGSRSPGF